jgi:hypothetical protein
MQVTEALLFSIGMMSTAIYGSVVSINSYLTSLTIGYLASGDPDDTIRQDMLFVPSSNALNSHYQVRHLRLPHPWRRDRVR